MPHLLVPLLYSLLFIGTFPLGWPYAQFAAGVFVGFAFFWLDRILHVFFVDPDHQFHQVVRQSWREGKYFSAVKLIFTQRDLQEKLITRSVLFFLTYLAVTLFVLTSTGSLFGIGLVLGIGLHFGFDFIRYYRNLGGFQRHFLWQVQRQWSAQEVRWLVGGFITFFGLISLIVILRG
jgi:hypothetical protein